MKIKIKNIISMASCFCLIAASLTGCSSTEVTEVTQTNQMEVQEVSQETSQKAPQDVQQPMEAPEMETVELPEEDIAALVQAGQNVVAEESDLWSIAEITDTELLMQLTQSEGGRERPDGESYEGDSPENMTPPDGEAGEGQDGDMLEGTMPERDGETPHENMEGTRPEDEIPEDGQGRGEGGGKQHSSRGGSMAALAIVISGTEDATLAAEDIFAQIQIAAEELGYQANSMELTEEQQSVIDVTAGYSVKMIVLINVQMPEMEAGEAVG